MKECKHCHRLLPEKEFYKNSRYSDGLQSYCISCVKELTKNYSQTRGKEKNKERAKKQYLDGYFTFGHGRYSNIKRNAVKRNINFNIDEEDFINWLNIEKELCYYCGSSLDEYKTIKEFILSYNGLNDRILFIREHVFKTERNKKIAALTIDRKNSKKGYELSNLCKACWICNSLKSNVYDEYDFKRIAVETKKIIVEEMMQYGQKTNKD